jgi:hypothetical protein
MLSDSRVLVWRCSEWVNMYIFVPGSVHGVALNITPNLSYEYVLLLSFFQMELSYLFNRVLI